MRFSYRAFDSKGVASDGEVEAASPTEATENVRRKGLYVSQIAPAEKSVKKGTRGAGSMRQGRRLKNLAMFSRQLQVLVSSGTPLVQAMSAIERQAGETQWRQILESLRQRVEEGSPLSEGMRFHPEAFDSVTISLMAAGEASGDMTSMLERLAVLSRKELQLRNVVAGALVYPCLLVCMGIGVMLTMLMFVLPRFADLFTQLDSPLPPTTQLLMWMSGLLLGYWWIAPPVLGGGIWVARWWYKSESGRESCENLMLRLPKVGSLVRSLCTAKLARMLGVLLESRVTLLDALKLTRESATHSSYTALLASAEDAVGRGEPISAILSTSNLIAPSVQEAIRNGEQSGKLGLPLVQMADFLDEENDVFMKSVTRLLEPLILACLGVLVGFVAISMFLPLFDLVSSAQQGGH